MKTAMIIALLLIALASVERGQRGVTWGGGLSASVAMLIAAVLLLSGCVDTINPVRYQPVEVLVTKPCLAGRNPPPEAQTRIAVTCDGKDCALKCSDTRPEECAKHMAADIIELQREARESRSLIKECSK